MNTFIQLTRLEYCALDLPEDKPYRWIVNASDIMAISESGKHQNSACRAIVWLRGLKEPVHVVDDFDDIMKTLDFEP